MVFLQIDENKNVSFQIRDLLQKGFSIVIVGIFFFLLTSVFFGFYIYTIDKRLSAIRTELSKQNRTLDQISKNLQSIVSIEKCLSQHLKTLQQQTPKDLKEAKLSILQLANQLKEIDQRTIVIKQLCKDIRYRIYLLRKRIEKSKTR